jgi:hypothetical protein
MPGTFDGSRQLALVFSTGTRLAARPYFAIFVNETPQDINVFVIDYNAFICTKLAGTRAVITRSWSV